MIREQLIKGIIILFLVIIGSVILVRTFTGGQTIADYAYENNIPEHPEDSSKN